MLAAKTCFGLRSNMALRTIVLKRRLCALVTCLKLTKRKSHIAQKIYFVENKKNFARMLEVHIRSTKLQSFLLHVATQFTINIT